MGVLLTLRKDAVRLVYQGTRDERGMTLLAEGKLTPACPGTAM